MSGDWWREHWTDVATLLLIGLLAVSLLTGSDDRLACSVRIQSTEQGRDR